MTATAVRQHGTYAMWNRNCRCDLCRRAAADYMAAWRARVVLGKGDPRHGTSVAYTAYGCRCRICRAGAQTRMPIPQSWLRDQLAGWFDPAGAHPFVGRDMCLICDKAHAEERDGEGTTNG